MSDIGTHVGDLISGYLDGELTQQQRQRVDIHCADCTTCRSLLTELTALRARIGDASLDTVDADTWRENVDDAVARSSRALGWLILLGALLVAGGIAVVEFLTTPTLSLGGKLLAGALYLAPVMLFISVLRQRLLERKTDKYKDVEI